jgi:hypothetical protein
MATILESQKPVEEKTVKDNLIFFQIMREKLEYQKLQAMKEVADAKYKVKSFSRQVREIEKTIAKIKEGKPIKIVIPEPDQTPTPCKILKPIEVAKEAPTPSLFMKSPSLFVKSNGFQNRSPNEVLDVQIYRRDWKCEKCNNLSFPNRKLFKEHISNIHSY